VLPLAVADVASTTVLQRTRSPLDALWTYRSALKVDTQLLFEAAYIRSITILTGSVSGRKWRAVR
jgi:hypothetical protein